jgi:hypothetical protein
MEVQASGQVGPISKREDIRFSVCIGRCGCGVFDAKVRPKELKP